MVWARRAEQGTSLGRPTAPPPRLAKASPIPGNPRPDPLVADEEAARGLVGEIDPAVAVDREQGGRRVVEHGFVEPVRVDELVALVAQLADSVVENFVQIAEARALAALGEALGEIAEADRA